MGAESGGETKWARDGEWRHGWGLSEAQQLEEPETAHRKKVSAGGIYAV